MPEDSLTPGAENEAPNDGALDNEPAGDGEEDPADLLAARLDAMQTRLDALAALDVNGVRSALGRISSIQSGLDELSKRNPVAELDPRVSASESAVVALAEALLADPGLADTTRSTLAGAMRAVEQARTARELDRREAALLAKMQESVRPAAAASETAADDPWQRASVQVRSRAAALNIDATTIPWNEIQTQSGGDPEAAAALAIEWLVEHKPDAPTAAVAARRAAAGNGSPRREAAAGSIEQIRERALNGRIPMTDTAARKALAADLGISL